VIMVTRMRNLLRLIALFVRRWFLVHVYGMHIAASARIAWGAILDKTYPRGIYIGDESFCASRSVILAHDYCRGIHTDTYIGKRCFIGGYAIVMPGVHVGDNVIVGAGAVVTRDVPSGCIVAGNPARIIRRAITTGKFGKLIAGAGGAEAKTPAVIAHGIGASHTHRF